MITFVIYHVPLPKETVKSSKVLEPFHRMDFNIDKILDLTFRSAVLFHPECRIVLLTSLHHQPKFSPEISDKVETVRYDVDATEPIVSRAWAEAQYLKEDDSSSHIVMLDGDMLINANLEDVFDADFDIALTYNDGKTEANQKMPINGGLKFIHSHCGKAALQFLQQVYELCESKHLAEYRTWWGDQYALIEAIGSANFWHRDSDKICANGVNVLLLPCDEYNFSPRCKAKDIQKNWKDKKILHFRGARKQYMPQYWNLYLATCEKRSVQCSGQALLTRMYLWLMIIKRR